MRKIIICLRKIITLNIPLLLRRLGVWGCAYTPALEF